MTPRRPIASLRNLGPRSAMMLAEVGIRTVEELEALGAVKAYARVKALGRRGASLNLLYAMAAGLENRGWQEVTAEEKAKLKAAVRAMQR